METWSQQLQMLSRELVLVFDEVKLIKGAFISMTTNCVLGFASDWMPDVNSYSSSARDTDVVLDSLATSCFVIMLQHVSFDLYMPIFFDFITSTTSAVYVCQKLANITQSLEMMGRTVRATFCDAASFHASIIDGILVVPGAPTSCVSLDYIHVFKRMKTQANNFMKKPYRYVHNFFETFYF